MIPHDHLDKGPSGGCDLAPQAGRADACDQKSFCKCGKMSTVR